MATEDVTAMALTSDKVLLRFWYDSAENKAVSAQEGRAIFDTVLMVDLIAPAQNASTPQIELERIWSPESLKFYGWEEGTTRRSSEYANYAEHITKFKANHEQMELGGTPLKQWPRISKGLASTLYAASIYTVEQVSAVADVDLGVLGMGGRELRDQAIEYLKEAHGTADASKLVAQIAELQQQVARLEAERALSNQPATEALIPAKLPDLGAPPAPSPLNF